MTTFDGRLTPRPDGGTEALMPTPTVQCHAANLAFLPNGDLACVWFGGTQEGVSDISVHLSRLRAGTDQWLDPVQLSFDSSRSEQNPILFNAPNGDVWLLGITFVEISALSAAIEIVVSILKPCAPGMRLERTPILA